jgi:spermidine dehydrogenase
MDRRSFLKTSTALAATALTAEDKLLGMDTAVQRGDNVNGRPAPSSTGIETEAQRALGQEEWDGYGGVGDYAISNGNTHEVFTSGHALRDHKFEEDLSDASDTGEIYDLVIVGGGICGLSAAHFFVEATGGKKTCLVLENHAIPGGSAKQNQFDVDGFKLTANQASCEWFPPFPGSFLENFYAGLGFSYKDFRYQEWGGKGPDLHLPNTPYVRNQPHSGFFFGKDFGHPEGLWITDPWGKKLEGAPISAKLREEWLRSHNGESLIPLPKAHGDEGARLADSMNLEQHMMRRSNVSQELIRTFYSGAGGVVGAAPDAISGYTDYAADMVYPWDYAKDRQMFPGGNTGIVRHMIKRLIPRALPGPNTLANIHRTSFNFAEFDRPAQPVRIRLSATVATVQHDDKNIANSGYVNVRYWQNGKMHRLRARKALMCGGNWTTPYTVVDLPETHRAAYRTFHRSPLMLVNVAVRNWRFMEKMGIAECQWFEGMGNTLALRHAVDFSGAPKKINPDQPTVMTFKMLFTSPGLPLQQQAVRGRMKMLNTPYADFERTIREQLTLMFARTGFDAKRDIAGIVLNRWGHAYLSPQPGFFFGDGTTPPPREILRAQPFGRIAFANCDLTGIMDHRATIDEAKRGVTQLLG